MNSPQNEPLDDLVVQLEAISAEFEPNTRKAATRTLLAIRDYLKATGVDARLCKPVVRVIAALHDLDRGIQPPLFAIEQGRKGRSSARKMLQGTAAAAVTFHMKAGLTRKDACKRVAQELRGRGVRVTVDEHRTKEEWKCVQGWRDHVLKAKPSTGMYESRVHYDNQLRAAETLLEQKRIAAGVTSISKHWYIDAVKAAYELLDRVNR